MELVGFIDKFDVMWSVGTAREVHDFLALNHYLGPIKSGGLVIVGRKMIDGPVVACQVWRPPTSRNLPSDGSWLELTRWCLTEAAGPQAGSRNHRFAVRLIKQRGVKTLVSYSDPSRGHTGALYRACNWQWAPTWLRLRPPPTGNGNWNGRRTQSVKDRWVFHVTKKDAVRSKLVTDDLAAVRFWQRDAPADQLRWAQQSDYMRAFLPSAA